MINSKLPTVLLALLAGLSTTATPATELNPASHGKVPVILYVKHRANDHFTVLRGIDADTVWLADPSLGNRTYSRAQFLKMWETRTGNVDGLAGKFLAVLPVNSQSPGESDFFSRTPIRQTKGAVSDLVHQSWRP